ncbi:hypothetical protein GCM10010330_22840 [Streptomyces tendae]|nr:hypothetical protein [Streptomyces tendae]GHA69095.1 hypothetical protein GCM10010330_22840 [Streptomyces tendae]
MVAILCPYRADGTPNFRPGTSQVLAPLWSCAMDITTLGTMEFHQAK